MYSKKRRMLVYDFHEIIYSVQNQIKSNIFNIYCLEQVW